MGELPNYKSYYKCLERLEVSMRIFPIGPTVLDVTYLAETYEEFLGYAHKKYGDHYECKDLAGAMTWNDVLHFLKWATV